MSVLDLQQRIQTLEACLTNQQVRADAAEKRADTLDTELVTALQRLHLKEQQVHDLQARCEREEAASAKLKADHDKLVEDHQITLMELEGANRKIDEMVPGDGIFMAARKPVSEVTPINKDERSKLEARIAKLRDMCDARQATISEQAARLSDLGREKNRLKERADYLDALVLQLRGELADDTPDYPTEVDEVAHETTHVLDRAGELVCGDRARDYGDPYETNTAIAAVWTVYLTRVVEREEDCVLDARDVTVMMVLFKALRDGLVRKFDNLSDICGYAQVGSWATAPEEDEE